MNIEEYRDFCLSLPGTTEETPFGPDTLVFKVGGKIFALTNLQTFASFNVKCDPEHAVELRERYDFVLPGFHMNKRHWNTILVGVGATDAQMRLWLTESYQLIVASLPKAVRAELAEAIK
ncbi:MmcQ/YjbR family DNA-binding protein [Hymenobacter ginsengisoli]|uniref:MmcQ/YjbR family DNA-binding protein n=1 Tax=Hymenobacter ginsengisoli TaxID=1051626 RepID=A0ABP8Q4J9_9BACT|nr:MULTISPECIES: MmcQ/YjbR family DNA-binding protein [unclassified Hymenobacter]MBO2031828.1 MmcQ/YjbR family DNA-binding protein [Hymenobacter sp. BT559]